MNFYPLGPTAFLNKLLGPTYPYHMVLAQHLYDKDFTPTDYFMYFRRRCLLNGYHIILDNGMYEEQRVSFDYLLRATLELNPHVVILPDVKEQMGATLSGGEVFKTLLKREKWKGKTMTVVQAERGNLEQHVHAYMEAVKQSRWVGLPRNADFGVGDTLCRRANFLRELVKRKVYQQAHDHHALGMRDGSLEELKSLAESGLVKSCDSSAPIWRGLQSFDLDGTREWKEVPFDPNEGWWGQSVQGDVAMRNMDLIYQTCQQQTTGVSPNAS